MDPRVLVEICVADVESAIAAEVGGADRVELCENLAIGGTTPSAGTIAEVCRWLSIPVHVLIRPRAGDFVYSDRELAIMRHDIEVAKSLGAAGVVLGVLTDAATIDRDRTAALVALARPLSVAFHKAIDQTQDLLAELDALIVLGVDRVLTSGGRPTALEGIETVAELVQRAGDRIAVMAGGRLSAEILQTVVERSGVREVHLGSAVSRMVASPAAHPARDGSETSWHRTSAQLVKIIVECVHGQSSGPAA
jgi:copper homeostasis protein